MARLYVRAILEMVGAPAEHVDKSLRDYVNALRKSPVVEVIKRYFSEPEPQDKLFSMYAEIEFYINSIEDLFNFVMEAMPSHIEILEPDEEVLTNKLLTDVMNNFIIRLHKVDGLVKDLNAKLKLLDKNMEVLSSNFIGHLVRDSEKDIKDISSITGIPLDKIEPILENLVKANKIEKVGETKYRLKKP